MHVKSCRGSKQTEESPVTSCGVNLEHISKRSFVPGPKSGLLAVIHSPNSSQISAPCPAQHCFCDQLRQHDLQAFGGHLLLCSQAKKGLTQSDELIIPDLKQHRLERTTRADCQRACCCMMYLHVQPYVGLALQNGVT